MPGKKSVHRLKRSFTSGELTPLLSGRVDLDKVNSGCRVLKNAYALSQGPAVRRPGFEFIYDLDLLNADSLGPVRLVPFIFNEIQAYALIFFVDTTGNRWVIFGYYNGGIVEDGSGNILAVDLGPDFDIENFDWAQSGDEMYLTASNMAPKQLVRKSATEWTYGDITFTSPPADWSDTNGWPERVTLHQQRLVFAANTLYKNKVWMSKAGDLFNFTAGTNADDSVHFALNSGTQNRIQWIASAQRLLLGTLGDEWMVTGSTQEAITPTNILAQRATNHGGEPMKPLMVGLATLFVEYHGRQVNEFVYDFNFDSYRGTDLSVLAPHLTETWSLTDWTYQQTPNKIIWAVREDGKLLGLTYQRDQKVVGWHQHETDGDFRAVTAIPGETREDRVWSIVQRVRYDGDIARVVLYVERMYPTFKSSEAVDGRFLDCWGHYSGAPTNTITGLFYLERRTVSVLADGAVHPDVVVKNGEITLNNEYSEVTVGLPYTTEIRPYLMDIPTQSGTLLGRTQRIDHIDVMLDRSLGMWIGRDDTEDGEFEEEKPFRVPGDLTGNPVPLFTGTKHYEFPEGFDRKSEYFIRQKQPLPLTVVAVIDKVRAYE